VELVNPIDATLVHWLQISVQKSWIADTTIVFVGTSMLLRGSAFAALLWWLWWRYESQRDRVIAAFTSSILAVIVARVIALIFSFRVRPLFDATLRFRAPFEGAGVYRGTELIGWSSFPSDHAALFFALAAGAFFISRRLGMLSGLYATLVVCFPRVYMGIHYPTDILAGAMLGFALGCALQLAPMRRALFEPVVRWSERNAAGFYALAFLATSQMAVMFSELHTVARKVERGLSFALSSADKFTAGALVAILLLSGSWAVLRLVRSSQRRGDRVQPCPPAIAAALQAPDESNPRTALARFPGQPSVPIPVGRAPGKYPDNAAWDRLEATVRSAPGSSNR
jgi:undecaprenyl-diphosphatase